MRARGFLLAFVIAAAIGAGAAYLGEPRVLAPYLEKPRVVAESLWHRISDRKPEAPPAPPLPPAVNVVRAREATLIDLVVVTGTLVPRSEVLVGPEVEGLRIADLLAEEGDRVEKGAVLARLSRETLDAQVAQNDAALARNTAMIAQARSQIAQSDAGLTEAESALNRAKSLKGTGIMTEASMDQRVAAALTARARLAASRDGLALAEAERKQTEAQRKELMIRLARTEVRAPAAGLVSRRNARLGAIASAAGEPLFRIIANGEVELDAEVPETRLLKLREGQPAALTLADGREASGRVRLVSPEVDRATRLGRVRVALDSGPVVRVGSFARGAIEAARRQGVAVPSAAILYNEAGATLLVVDGDRVAARRVTLGLAVGERVEIATGLGEGEWVVARAGAFLHDGDRVRPVPQDAKGDAVAASGVTAGGTASLTTTTTARAE